VLQLADLKTEGEYALKENQVTVLFTVCMRLVTVIEEGGG
jgi:hypothetical protein